MTRCPHPGCGTPTTPGKCAYPDCPNTEEFHADPDDAAITVLTASDIEPLRTFTEEEVILALEEEELTGELTYEMYAQMTVTMDAFVETCAALVDSTRRSIAKRLGVRLACDCTVEDCPGKMEPGCGHRAMFDQLELLATEDGVDTSP